MSGELSESGAAAMIVIGCIEPIVKELPMECAVEMNCLIQLQMEARSAGPDDGGRYPRRGSCQLITRGPPGPANYPKRLKSRGRRDR